MDQTWAVAAAVASPLITVGLAGLAAARWAGRIEQRMDSAEKDEQLRRKEERADEERRHGEVKGAIDALSTRIDGIGEDLDVTRLDARESVVRLEAAERQIERLAGIAAIHESRLVQIETAHRQNHGG